MGEDELSFSSTHAVDGRALRRRKRTWRQRLVTLGTVVAVCYTTLVTLVCVYVEEQRAAARPEGLAFLPERNHDDETSSNQPRQALHIFYNVFLPATLPEFAAGLAVVDEQMEQMMHNLQVPAVRQAYGSIHLHYTLIGAAFPSQDYLEERYCRPHGVQCSPSAHLASGNEEHTLQALYDHCHHHEAAAVDAADATTTTVVAYLHSKGTFHPTPRNRNFRRALTDAALHVDCLTLSVDHCNVCGLQFVPFPIHAVGNMWVASCDYIKGLVPPKDFGPKITAASGAIKDLASQDRLSMRMSDFSNTMMGLGRYANQQWIGTHPDVVPCQVSNAEARLEMWRNRDAATFNSTLSGQAAPVNSLNETKLKWLRHLEAVQDEEGRRREICLLPGLFQYWNHLYGGARPRPDSWFWTYFPDGDYFRSHPQSEW